MSLTIIRDKKHPFDTMYGGVTIRPGSSTVLKQADVDAILADPRFVKDRAAGLFQVEEVNAPAAEAAAESAPKEDLLANAKAEAKAVAELSEKDAIKFCGLCVEPRVLFQVFRTDKRAKVQKAARAALAVIYGRELTDEEMAGE